MSLTKIDYYITSEGKNPIVDFLDSLEKIQKAKILRLFQTIECYGIDSIIAHIKKLTGTSLWEIRLLGKDNIRVIYFFIKNDTLLLLHGFIKKTQKTSQRDLSIALSRYVDWKNRKES